MKFKKLDGMRIKLIPLSQDRINDFHAYSSKKIFYKYLEFEPFVNKQQSAQYLQKLIDKSNQKDAYYWFIFHIAADKVIGTIGVHDIDSRKKDGEISYGISPDFWGKGIFTETLRVLLTHLFQDLGFYRITAVTQVTNYPSNHGLLALGFKVEGTLKDYYLSSDNSRYDANILALLKNEFDV